MEQDNKKLRSAGRKEFNETVRVCLLLFFFFFELQ